MNLDVWNDLSDQHKAIIDNATKATTHYQLSQTLANNGAALARLAGSRRANAAIL